jgi:hypothetical protein
MQTTGEQTMPELIAPDPACRWCVEAMRDLTLTGQSLVVPGRAGSDAAAAIAAELHALGHHVHCGRVIGDLEHTARAEIALPLLTMPTVVAYDAVDNDVPRFGLIPERTIADRRMHWAHAVAESMTFARVGWRVIRVREAGLEPTSPLDIVLPRPITGTTDDKDMLRLAVGHVLGIVEANVVAAA